MKWTGLPARVAVALTDIVNIVDAAAGTPASWKATVAQLRAALMPVALAADVSGTLPVGNGGTGLTVLGTALQVMRTNAGATAMEWAAAAAAAGGAGAVQTSNGTGGFVAPTNVLAGNGYISVGVTPAASGAFRLANASEVNSMAVDGLTTMTMMTLAATNRLHIGMDAGYAKMVADVNIFPSTSIGLGINGGNYLDIVSGNLATYKPIIGSVGGSSPFAVHGEGLQALPITASVTTIVPAAVYCFRTITTTGALTANQTVQVPAAASDAAGREFTARNTCTGAFGNIYTTGAGTTVTVANGKTAVLGVDSGGVYRVTADV